MRRFISFDPGDLLFRNKLVHYTSVCTSLIILETLSDHEFDRQWSSKSYRLLAGIGALDRMTLAQVQKRSKEDELNDWYFGFIGYDYKNHIEKLESSHPDGVDFPELLLIRPEYVILQDNEGWEIGFDENFSNEKSALQLVADIKDYAIPVRTHNRVEIRSRVEKETYLQNVIRIKEHIHRGDIYEMNYCIEFFDPDAKVQPQDLYLQLVEKSPVPFAAFMKVDDRYLMCASPERFIKKEADRVISQPIKGTLKRQSEGPESQEIELLQLLNSEKDRTENIMITDLVRNDLSRIAQRGTVKVDELCGVYPFKQVYQMISTISARLKPGLTFIDVFRQTFPMGSMTGAPKIKAMQLIEEFEITRRGLYSGSVGYITPDGDFDFNVVIRSLFYNRNNHYLSYMVGSAITSMSDPEEEYAECMVKAKAIQQVLGIEI